MMPLKKDPLGVDREHDNYCSYCFADGKLTYEGDDVNEFKSVMVEKMVANGESRLKAKLLAFGSGFAPRWKNR